MRQRGSCCESDAGILTASSSRGDQARNEGALGTCAARSRRHLKAIGAPQAPAALESEQQQGTAVHAETTECAQEEGTVGAGACGPGGAEEEEEERGALAPLEALAHRWEGECGIVYQEWQVPDRADPEGWRLSWDYASRFAKPIEFRVPSGRLVSIAQHASSKDQSVVAADPIDSAVTVWDSSLVVACMLCRYPLLVKDKRVLEVGSGTGLLGCITAALGPSQVSSHAAAFSSPPPSASAARAQAQTLNPKP